MSGEPGFKVSYKNPHGISVDEETWQALIKLQELTKLSKPDLIRLMIRKEMHEREKRKS